MHPSVSSGSTGIAAVFFGSPHAINAAVTASAMAMLTA
jgi:hypothetical protein